ncbi:hypothetical protein ACHHYP_14249 [Achlya hypogyna]|uniref:Uncharacterized protein n=1 Tax=Achlya hypogyna TaxID=1202772 RepID=A0A1V9YDN0_ACHHY|nr:hypothetical protein ACHHYP_14249 [Achlya hypogyna]
MASKRPHAQPAMPSREALESRLQEATADLAACKKDIVAIEAEIGRLQKTLKDKVDILAKKRYELEDLDIVRDSLLKRLDRYLVYAENVSAGGIPIVDIEAPIEKRLRTSPSPQTKKKVKVITITESPPALPPRDKKRKISVAVSPMSPPIPTKSSNKSVASPAATNFPDQFWGSTDTAKYLSLPRTNMVSDGCGRKLRCSAFHPTEHDTLSTFSDDGTMMLWQYLPHFRDLRHVLQVPPAIFRVDGQACVEDFSWFKSGGNKIALGFRDPAANMGEICVVEWGAGFQKPPDRVWNRSSSLVSKGIAAIEWLDDSHIVTGGANHSVVVWKYTDSAPSPSNMQTLHSDHRSEIRALCVHEHSSAIFSGALDGLVIRYDLHHQSATTIVEKRLTNNIAKINSVLAHPNHPHLLMVSCVNANNQTLLLHDLRMRQPTALSGMPSMVWYKSTGDSRPMSQLITPRWSTAGMHVSCGSTGGEVHLWDIRACKRDNVPHQSMRIHQKPVLHANWHAKQNVLMSISNDRHIGVITFQ